MSTTATTTMRAPRGLTAAERFFWVNAGWSYTPGKESPEQGRANGACNLAAAEGIAREAGYSFTWRVDPAVDSRTFSASRPYWELYECLMHDINGEVVQVLGAVDFGRGAGGPFGDYRRVVEAELAAQEVGEQLEQVAT